MKFPFTEKIASSIDNTKKTAKHYGFLLAVLLSILILLNLIILYFVVKKNF